MRQLERGSEVGVDELWSGPSLVSEDRKCGTRHVFSSHSLALVVRRKEVHERSFIPEAKSPDFTHAFCVG